jgi:hypothetical protein
MEVALYDFPVLSEIVYLYNFLQFYNPSSIQARRFFLELAENGHQITVLTNKEKNTIEFQHKNISKRNLLLILYLLTL